MIEPPASLAPTPYVFLSYASAEQDRALAVGDALQQAGIRSWLDRHAIAGGTAWSAEIVDGITGCAAFIVLGSERSFRSPNVQRELSLAVEENRPLLPLLLERAEQPREVRYALAGRQWVLLLDRPAAAWLPEVLRALAGLGIAATVPAEPAAAPAVSPPTNLPASLTSFLGREQELTGLAELLASNRLVTLTGPGGTGKTRLALAAAARAADRFPDGAWFVDLSGVTDPAGVIPAIAVLLEVKESDGRSLAVSLAAYLRRKRLLLVIDNFEQVVAAAMALYDLLAEAPGLSVLVTSRILLHVGGEQEYSVPPLPSPQQGAGTEPTALRANPAVQLFLDRARALRSDLDLDDDALRAVGAICARLDGLPLAIELAAARVKLLAPAQLLVRLERRLPLLTGGVRSLPARQQTLRATIAWSWDLLPPAEQVLFRRLAAFAGSFTLEAAEAVCNTDGELDVLEGLSALVDQSLVRQREQGGEPRFSLLATLQEFALEQLEAAGEAPSLRRAHAAYYATLAKEAGAASANSGRMRQDLLRPLEPERDNILLALGWAEAEQDAVVGLRLGGPVGFWFYLRTPGEGKQWLQRLLSIPGAAGPSAARGRTLLAAAACAVAQGDSAANFTYLEEAVTCFRVTETLPGLSRALVELSAFLPASEQDRAQALAEEGIQLARTVGGVSTIAYAEGIGGWALLLHGGNRAAARGHVEEGLRLARALDADWLPMFLLGTLATLAEAEGEHEQARARWQEALPLAEALGDHMHVANTCMGLARFTAMTGEQDEAAAHWRRALLLARDLGSNSAALPCLAGIAGFLSARRRFEPAARLLAASDRLREGVEQHALYGPHFRAAYPLALNATRAALSPDVLARAWAEGLALSLDGATDLAFAELAAALPTTSTSTAGA